MTTPPALQEVVAAWSRGATDAAAAVGEAVQLLADGVDESVVLPIAMLPPRPSALELDEALEEAYAAAGRPRALDLVQAHRLALRWIVRRYFSGDVTADAFCAWAGGEWTRLNRPEHLTDFVLHSDCFDDGVIGRDEFTERVDAATRHLGSEDVRLQSEP